MRLCIGGLHTYARNYSYYIAKQIKMSKCADRFSFSLTVSLVFLLFARSSPNSVVSSPFCESFVLSWYWISMSIHTVYRSVHSRFGSIPFIRYVMKITTHTGTELAFKQRKIAHNRVHVLRFIFKLDVQHCVFHSLFDFVFFFILFSL